MNTINAPACGEQVETGKVAGRVLLAVDDLKAREILRDQVCAAGFAVHEAANGTAAWEKLHSLEVDVTILLLTEGGSEAAEFVRRVRKEKNFETHPIWVCTLLPSVKHSRSSEPGTTAFCNLLSTSVFAMLAQVSGQLSREDSPPASESELARRVPSETASRIVTVLEQEIISLVDQIRALRDGDEVTRTGKCADLSKKVGSLVTCAAVAGRCRLARYAAAIRSLLEEITMRPNALTGGCMQTLITAAESLAALNGRFAEESSRTLTAVIISDAMERRGSAESGLAKAGFQATAFSDGDSAIKHLTGTATDLIIVHLHTPAEEIALACKVVRKLALHTETPMVVTGLASQFKQPELLLAAGANEVLFQPSAQMEIAVAGLALVHRRASQTQEAGEAIGITPEPSREGNEQSPTPPTDIAFVAAAEVLSTGVNEAPSDDPPDNLAGQTEVELIGRCRELGRQLDVMSRLYLEAEAKAVEQHDEKTKALKMCGELQDSLQEKTKEMEMLTTNSEPANADVSGLEARVRELTEELEFAQEEIKEIKKAQTALAQQKETAEAEITRLKECAAAAPGDRAARIEAELERERSDKRRVEQRMVSLNKHLEELHARTSDFFETERVTQEKLAALDRQLHERDEELSRAQAELQKATADRRSALEQLRAGEALMKELREAAAVYASAKDALQRRHEQVEARLQVVEAAANDAQVQLKTERSERAKYEEELAAVRQRAQEQEASLAELRCELELEQADKKRVAGEAAESRYSALEATRATAAAVNALRESLREPMDKLLATSRQLLEAELAAEVKQSVESLLANGLALQSRIKE